MKGDGLARATFFKYREAHYPFRFSSDGGLTT